MNCPECTHPHSTVLDVRRHEGGLRRRRHCAKCGHNFVTEERVPAAPATRIRHSLERVKQEMESFLREVSP